MGYSSFPDATGAEYDIWESHFALTLLLERYERRKNVDVKLFKSSMTYAKAVAQETCRSPEN
jgi:hypothetical protein